MLIIKLHLYIVLKNVLLPLLGSNNFLFFMLILNKEVINCNKLFFMSHTFLNCSSKLETFFIVNYVFYVHIDFCVWYF